MPSTKEVLKCMLRPAGGARSLDVQYFPEAATQSFKRGDIVGLTSGKVRCNVTANGSNLDSSGDEVCGVAMADASGVTDTSIPVVVLNTNVEICLPVTHGTPASAITAVTDPGSTTCLERTGVGDWSVPIDDTSNPVFEITQVAEQYAVGEQYGWVWGKIIAAERTVAA